MDDKETRDEHALTHDPIAIEPFLWILSIAITSIGVAHQLGLIPGRNRPIRQGFHRLRNEILRLNNCLDDLILTIRRYEHYEDRHLVEGARITERRTTLSDTLIDLRHEDYLRWRDLEDKIQGLNRSVYRLVARLRALASDLEKDNVKDNVTETLSKDVFAPVDELLINLSSMTLGEFVAALRTVLRSVDSTLVEISTARRQSRAI